MAYVTPVILVETPELYSLRRTVAPTESNDYKRAVDKTLLKLARRIAIAKQDERTYRHGAVGVRKDGAIVASSNGNPEQPDRKHHAEYRVIRKLGRGGKLYVVRVLKSGRLADSTPCKHCQKLIQSKDLEVVYFSNANGDIVQWNPEDGGIEEAWVVSRSKQPQLSDSTAILNNLYPSGITGLSAWITSTATFFGVKRTEEEEFCGPPDPTPMQLLESKCATEYRLHIERPYTPIRTNILDTCVEFKPAEPQLIDWWDQ